MKCPKCGKLILSNTQLMCPKCYAVLKDDGNAGPFQYGIKLMSQNKFQDAANVWRSDVLKYGSPSDAEYKQIVDASCDCILQHLGDSTFYSRENFTDLAMDLSDRELMEDLMAGLVNYIPEAKTKMQIHRLSAEYTYFMFNAFFVYPDIRDMSSIMKRSHDVFCDIRTRIDELPGNSKNAELEIDFFKDYTTMIAGKIDMNVARNRSNMNAVVDYWATKKSLTYALQAIDSAREYSRVATAKRPSEKRINARMADIDEFLNIYFGEPMGRVSKNDKKKGKK